MRLVVCVKQVIGRDASITVDSAGRWLDETQASWELNEPDAYALEAALALRERHGGEVVVVSAGPARAVDVLREAMARGADRAVHVAGDHLASADTLVTAAALQAALADEPADLVLAGLQSDDVGAGQVGVVLAERLGLPHATLVMAIDVEDNGFRVKRELEGGWSQWLRLPRPALVTVQSGINQLRYATLKGIMAARRKAIRTVTAPDPGPQAHRLLSLVTPERRKQTVLFDGAPADAARRLVNALVEGRVL